DEAKEAHDHEVVKSVHDQAIKTARKVNIIMPKSQKLKALRLFPKVAGLACKVHDSTTLQEEFEKTVIYKHGKDSQKWHLDQCVPTCSNSNFACLCTHLHFKEEVRLFTTQNNLLDYALIPAQWKLANHLVPVLEIFNEVTNLFLKANVPLIYEVIPMLEHLEHSLDQIYNAKNKPPVIQIATQAALQVVGKYYALTDDNEVCCIAVIMCPEKMLKWFKKNLDWHKKDHMEAKQIVQQCWDESYA
ncbi:hypothetical protein BDR06DRAFT_838249, partial [Suillus hirtellus]